MNIKLSLVFTIAVPVSVAAASAYAIYNKGEDRALFRSIEQCQQVYRQSECVKGRDLARARHDCGGRENVRGWYIIGRDPLHTEAACKPRVN